MEAEAEIFWQPGERERQGSQLARYMEWLSRQGYGRFTDYPALHDWSIRHPESFWRSVWRFSGLIADTPWQAMTDGHPMPRTRWLPGAELNFARNLLRRALEQPGEAEAIVAYCESRSPVRKTCAELLHDVGAFEAFLRNQGVQVGDRVAGLITNGYEAMVAMLAATSLGAVWSSASPDFGVEATVDRFGQIEPVVLVAVNGYRFNGKDFPRGEETARLLKRIPSIRRVVVVEQLPAIAVPEDQQYAAWEDALAMGSGQKPSFTPLPAHHPVYILFSSGTTGQPKCIVHGAGGLLLNHAKELMLHGDIGPGDRLLYYTTCGWMMWNWQASALLTGAALVVYDGSPGAPDLGVLWRTVANEGVTHFGTSARFLAACRKADLTPGRELDLSRLRVVFSTGSPLLPEDFDWFYDAVDGNVLLGSIAGGTDICGCFVGCNPLLPVRRGEIQCRLLGVDVVAFNEGGRALEHDRGELVCRQPLPSMPVGFWNDPEGKRYHGAYFETFPGVWAHGDFVSFTPSGGAIIHGRSDATLNPGGVRIGTAEIYRQVETITEIADSVVVGRPVEGDVEVVLLVVPAEGVTLDSELVKRLRQRIRDNASPRHVPRHILQVDAIPYTRSGKKMELAVVRLLRGEGEKENRSAMANPESLDHIDQVLRRAGLVAG